MPYCLNTVCSSPQNSADEVCQSCGTALKLCDRYQALKPIGQGGFGRTFLAVDLSESMKPRCVIKQLYPQQQGAEIQAKASDLFRQEAQQLLTAGQYPSIPTFLDYFEQDGFQYLVQEFIEGQNLAEVLAMGRTFTESEVKGLLETMLETIDFLHHRKIIHRDIKPANIIQTPNGRFVLVDLGAAKLMTGTALGQTGTVIGSAEYVAPEQLRGKAIFASDLYSLGATCMTLLTGMSPFSLFDTSTGSWEWRDYLVQNTVSETFGKILDRLLIGPTKQRYGSANKVLQDLEKRSDLTKIREIDPWQKEALMETVNPGSGAFLSISNGPWWRGKALFESEVQADKRQFAFREAEPTTELGIEPTQAGEVVEKRDDRNNANNRKESIVDFSPTLSDFSPMVMVVGIIIAVPFTIMLAFAHISSQWPKIEAPAPEAPISSPPIEQPSANTNVVDLTGVTPLGDIIKPAYNNPIKPFKVFRNIPPFKTVSLKDGGKTIVTGLLSRDGKVNLNFLAVITGKSTNASFQAGLNVQGTDYYSIGVQEDNIFLKVSGQTRPQMKVFNLRSKSFIYSTYENERFGNKEFIFPDLDTDLELSDIGFSTTTSLVRIFGSKVSEREVKVPAGGGGGVRNVLSSDKTTMFNWHQGSNSQADSPLITTWSLETGKLKSRFGLPNTIFDRDQVPELLRAFQYAGNQFLVTSGGLPPLDSRDGRKVIAYLPDLYKDKDTKPIMENFLRSHYVIHVLDITQGKVKYFIPRVGVVVGLAVSSDGKTMVTVETAIGGRLSKLMIWDLPTGKLIRSVDKHYSSNCDDIEIHFTADNKSLVVAAPDIRFGGGPQKSAETPDITIWNVNQLRNP